MHAVVKKVGHDKKKWYAMKTLDKKALRKSNLLKEIKNEFDLLKDLNFIFTINLFYCFQDDKCKYPSHENVNVCSHRVFLCVYDHIC